MKKILLIIAAGIALILPTVKAGMLELYKAQIALAGAEMLAIAPETLHTFKYFKGANLSIAELSQELGADKEESTLINNTIQALKNGKKFILASIVGHVGGGVATNGTNTYIKNNVPRLNDYAHTAVVMAPITITRAAIATAYLMSAKKIITALTNKLADDNDNDNNDDDNNENNDENKTTLSDALYNALETLKIARRLAYLQIISTTTISSLRIASCALKNN